MNLHKHARLTPRGRALLVQRMLNGLRVEDAAQAAGVSVRTAYKWLKRFREEGEIGLMDRSSRPHSCPHATAIALVEQLIELRRSRKTYRQIAQILGLAVSTVARRLKQAGFHRLAELEPAPVVVRYEYANPGDLLHLDIKKLGRFWKPGHRVTGDRQQCSDGAGWEFMHVAIDDASRLAFTSLHPDERGSSASAINHPVLPGSMTLDAGLKRNGHSSSSITCFGKELRLHRSRCKVLSWCTQGCLQSKALSPESRMCRACILPIRKAWGACLGRTSVPT